jgi:hypothetical protein
VEVTDAVPAITVDKSASPTTIGSVGSGLPAGFGPDITFDSDWSDPGGNFYTLPTCDDQGPNDEPGQVDLNCFNRADDGNGDLAVVQWTWDEVDAWTGTGQTGDACSLLDTDGDGNANYALCVRVTNNGDGTEVFQLPSPESPILYPCSDRRPDRCTQPDPPVDLNGTNCSVVRVDGDGVPGGDDGADTEATCDLDLDSGPLAAEPDLELINVCTFPSGEPNSNAFDCIVQPGAGFIRIEKQTSPSGTGALFGFTLNPGATDGTSAYAVEGGITSGLIPVQPGDDYELTEILPEFWELDQNGASCLLGGTPTGSLDNASGQMTGIAVASGQTTTCTFTNSWWFEGDVTYTVEVTNLSEEEVSLSTLTDNMFGDLIGVGGVCAAQAPLGSAIAPAESLTCTFTKSLSGGHGTDHKNIVTATASDDEGNTASDVSLEVTVTIWYPTLGP